MRSGGRDRLCRADGGGQGLQTFGGHLGAKRGIRTAPRSGRGSGSRCATAAARRRSVAVRTGVHQRDEHFLGLSFVGETVVHHGVATVDQAAAERVDDFLLGGLMDGEHANLVVKRLLLGVPLGCRPRG